MAKIRLSGVVTVYGGIAVQSIGFKRYLPLGKPEHLVKNLDTWGADEIIIQCIDRSLIEKKPYFELVERLGNLGITTPLIYSGGIKNIDDATKLIRLGADRLIFNSLFQDDQNEVMNISKVLGSQAIIVCMPLENIGGKIKWYDYRNRKTNEIRNNTYEFLNSGYVSEILVSDWLNDGFIDKFNINILKILDNINIPVIAFGGISSCKLISKIIKYDGVISIAIGNALNYKEHGIQLRKSLLESTGLFRISEYK